MSAITVKICTGRSCTERHSEYISKRLTADIDFYSYGDDVEIESCLCQGRCKEGPTVAYGNDIQSYQNPIKASELLRKKVAEVRKRMKERK